MPRSDRLLLYQVMREYCLIATYEHCQLFPAGLRLHGRWWRNASVGYLDVTYTGSQVQAVIKLQQLSESGFCWRTCPLAVWMTSSQYKPNCAAGLYNDVPDSAAIYDTTADRMWTIHHRVSQIYPTSTTVYNLDCMMIWNDYHHNNQRCIVTVQCIG